MDKGVITKVGFGKTVSGASCLTCSHGPHRNYLHFACKHCRVEHSYIPSMYNYKEESTIVSHIKRGA